MTFKSTAVTLAGTDTIIFETPVGYEGSNHGLVFSNPTGGSVDLTLKFFDFSAGTTVTFVSTLAIAADAQFTWPKPINLNSGDQIIGSGTGLIAMQSTFINDASVPSGFTHLGAWSAVTTYSINDVVSLSGASYVSLEDNNLNISPPSAEWGIIASKGDTGAGNVSGVASSVDGEIALFDSTTGKLIKRATTTGLLKAASGVIAAATAGTDYVAPGTATTFTAQQTFQEIKDTVHTITDGAAFELDPANGGIQVVTLGANRSPLATNFEAGQAILLGIDDGTAYTVTWPSVTWLKSGGTAAAPTLATSGYTWVVLFKQGSTLFGSIVGSP